MTARVARRFKFLEQGAIAWPELDPVLLVLVVLLPLVGVVAVATASMPAAAEEVDPSGASTLRHLVIALAGVGVALVASQIDYHHFGERSWIGYFLVIGLLMLVLLPGAAVAGGPKRWLDLPLLNFQPSELAKPVLIIHLSFWAAKLGPKLTQPRWFATGVAVAALPIALIIIQPDLSTAGLICITAIAVAITAGAKVIHLLALIPLGAAVGAISVFANPYQLTRVRTFIGLEGSPLDSGYQSQQALLALGSGGIGGKGLGLGTVKSWLPAAHTDSVFAVIGEEFGLIGTGLLLLTFLILLARGLWVATHSSDLFGRCLAAGISFQIATQAFVNMGVAVGLFPVTGVPLPFVSSGGTSLLVSLAMMGILINIARSTTLRKTA